MSTESQGDQCACVSSGHRVPGGVYVLGKDIGSQVQGYRVPGGPTCLCQGWSKTGVGVIVSTLRVIGYWEGGGRASVSVSVVDNDKGAVHMARVQCASSGDSHRVPRCPGLRS